MGGGDAGTQGKSRPLTVFLQGFRGGVEGESGRVYLDQLSNYQGPGHLLHSPTFPLHKPLAGSLGPRISKRGCMWEA